MAIAAKSVAIVSRSMPHIMVGFRVLRTTVAFRHEQRGQAMQISPDQAIACEELFVAGERTGRPVSSSDR